MMIGFRSLTVCLTLLLQVLQLVQVCHGQGSNGNLTIYELAQNDESLVTFTTVLELAGLNGGALNDSTAGPFTVLAPENEAFESVPGKYLEAAWKDYLIALLSYHVLIGPWPASALSENLTLPTAFTGKTVSITESDPLTFEDTGMIINGNFPASNGIVHVINAVLQPPTMALTLLEQAEMDPTLTRFVELVKRFDLTPTLSQEGPLTLLIPTNDAFAKIPDAILNQLDANALTQIMVYHVLPEIQFAYTLETGKPLVVTTLHGTSLSLNPNGVVGAASFVSTDTMASNGVWHTVDTLLLPVVTTAAPVAPTPAPAPTIFDVASGVNDLSDFVNAAVLADLDQPLSMPGPLTVWAPINAAFDAMPLKLYEPAWKLHLASVLSYHVVPLQSILTTDLSLAQQLPTVEGTDVLVTQVDPEVVLNGNAQVVTENAAAANGILHAIDNLLLPPWVMTTVSQIVTVNDDVSTLVELLSAHDMLGVLGMEGPYTLLAPVNAAFDKVPISVILDTLDYEGRVEVLSYHVIPQLVSSEQMINGATFMTLQGTEVRIMSATIRQSSEIRVNDASVIGPDVLANNGVIHYLDTVLIPVIETPEPTNPPTVTFAPTMTPSMAPTNETDMMMTIGEIVLANEDLTVLAAAINATGLYPALDATTSTLTLFAPTDAAFIKSGLNLTQFLLPDWEMHLISLLTYHVIIGQVLDSQLEEDMMAITLNGNSITVTEAGETASINNVTVEIANIMASNGIVHVLADGVLLPPSALYAIPERAAMIPTLTTFLEYLGETELDLSTGGPYTVFAPTNEFAENLEEVLMSEGVEALTRLLSHHVVTGMYLSGSLTPGLALPTLAGTTIQLNANNINSINNADILASNGVIHEAEFILTPPTVPTGPPVDAPTRLPTPLMSINQLLIGDPEYSILSAALNATGLDAAVDTDAAELTLFAPSDVAFQISGIDLEKYLQPEWESHLSSLLSYHVVVGTILSDSLEDGLAVPTLEGTNVTFVASGGGFNVNGAPIIDADQLASNGVVHGLAGVLLPPSASNSVVDLAAKSSELTILVSALNSTGLLLELAGPGPFTVFAPSNEAFIVADLPFSDQSIMRDALAYHVVDGIYTSEDLVPGMQLVTHEGSEIIISDFGAVNNAEIATSDNLANNGVLHVINAVLSPEYTLEPSLVDTDMPTGDMYDTLAPTTLPVSSPTAATSSPTEVPYPTSSMISIEQLQGLPEEGDCFAVERTFQDTSPNPDTGCITGQVNYQYDYSNDLDVTIDFTAACADPSANTCTMLVNYVKDDNVYAGECAACRVDSATQVTMVTCNNLGISIFENGPQTVEFVHEAIPDYELQFFKLADTESGCDMVYGSDSPSYMDTMVDSMAPSPSVTSIETMPLEETFSPSSFMSDQPGVLPTVLELVASEPSLVELSQLLKDSGVASTLTTKGPFTVFAPNQDGFDALPAFLVARLLRGETLVHALSYHVVAGTYLSSDLEDGMVLTTLQGGTITIGVDGDVVTVTDSSGNAVTVVVADDIGSNGVVHQLSGVLLPLLDDTTGPTGSPVSGAVTTAPSVTPSPAPVTSQPVPTAAPFGATQNLLEFATNLGATSDFVALLLDAADLSDVLTKPGPYTMLAPSNGAFSSLPDGYLAGLSEEDKVDLVSYHLIPGKYYLADLQRGVELLTLRGNANITFGIPPANLPLPAGFVPLLINNETIPTQGDFEVSNGIVHVVDSIMIPPSPKADYDMLSTSAPSDDSTASDRIGPWECDEYMLAYASDCCPPKLPGLASFCQDLFERSDDLAKSLFPSVSPTSA
ncbi:beta-induced protein ig-h3 [Seminavis robusta]|uniref:Beta-induced protein ig-h3 n=1 Tax=Seminavis robusta TaxID=568900 RepID=A0A9N8EU52_9STRA|nr:beta-induced protein ig-h3 [Seminavis robusta]|eukprot:Sro1768_g296380.1 beta-induced protein ig-h3 (1795) ;mRNA; r:11770-17243